MSELGPPDKRCDWPEWPPGSGRWGCGQPVWFRPTPAGRAQVTDADGRDHHQTCRAFLAMVERERDRADDDQLTLF